MKYGFFLISPDASRSGLRLIVRHNKVRYTKCLKGTVSTSQWNQSAQKYKSSANDAGVINADISNFSTALDTIERDNPTIVNSKHFWELVDCVRNGKDFTTVDPNAKMLVNYMESQYIPRFLESKTARRIQRFEATVSLLKKFELSQHRSYTLAEVDAIFYRHLEAFFVKEKYSLNYFGSIIKIVKQVMREAIYVDHISSNEGFRAAGFTATTSDVDSVYLTDSELRRIHALQIDEAFIKQYHWTSEGRGVDVRIQSYTIAKNLFLIGAYTGLRVSDFSRLRSQHFMDGKITIVTAKTKAKVVIPIHPIVREILANGFDLTLPLCEQKVRTYIKHICEAAGIDEVVEVRGCSMAGVTVERKAKWELVSTHTARRSFATNAYLAGVPTLAIMKITGHTKESTFMRYIRISQLENANALANHPFFN